MEDERATWIKHLSQMDPHAEDDLVEWASETGAVFWNATRQSMENRLLEDYPQSAEFVAQLKLERLRQVSRIFNRST